MHKVCRKVLTVQPLLLTHTAPIVVFYSVFDEFHEKSPVGLTDGALYFLANLLKN